MQKQNESKLQLDLVFPHTTMHCRVLIGPKTLASIADIWPAEREQAVIIGDDNTLNLFGLRVRTYLQEACPKVYQLSFPPGEHNKTRQTKRRLEDQMLDLGIGRRCVVVALGGGICLDVAGFVASTYMRGVPTINIPTSLLAQIDAAIGGKTGVNCRWGKNLIGTFHQPLGIILDPALPLSLDVENWRCGLAELIKHAIIADEALFERLEQDTNELNQPALLDPYYLSRSVEIKSSIVCADEKEHGLRAVLNFGHTVGHALENALEYQVSHGQAVAWGMQVEARAAQDLLGLSPKTVQRIQNLLKHFGFASFESVAFERVRPFLWMDKKNRDESIQVSLPAELGKMARGPTGSFTHAVTEPQLAKVWKQ